MNNYDLWIEGCVSTGYSSDAQFLGTYSGETFKDAILSWLKTGVSWNEKHFFDAQTLTYWGCKIFDNEKSARKSFG